MNAARKKLLVTGATGFIGRTLVPALLERGYAVRACARRIGEVRSLPGLQWRACDLGRPETLTAVLADMDAAFYLVHSMGAGGARDFAAEEERAARVFASAAAEAGLGRIVYLGGVAPHGRPSSHLASRLRVGEILRAGRVTALELRASMVIGPGSASWQIVRDLALRLPAMILPAWLESRTRPVALEDVIRALVDAVELELVQSAWFDLPGPEVLTGAEILTRVAALRGRTVPALHVPLLTPYLSALWLRLVTRTDFALARELVIGLERDLLPRDERYWELTGHYGLLSFDEAARRALAAEGRAAGMRARLAEAEEKLVDLVGPRLPPVGGPRPSEG